jgi:hypothetical protein
MGESGKENETAQAQQATGPEKSFSLARSLSRQASLLNSLTLDSSRQAECEAHTSQSDCWLILHNKARFASLSTDSCSLAPARSTHLATCTPARCTT